MINNIYMFFKKVVITKGMQKTTPTFSYMGGMNKSRVIYKREEAEYSQPVHVSPKRASFSFLTPNFLM